MMKTLPSPAVPPGTRTVTKMLEVTELLEEADQVLIDYATELLANLEVKK